MNRTAENLAALSLALSTVEREKAGWLAPEKAEALRRAVRNVLSEPIHQIPGEPRHGVSERFLLRLSLLKDAAGLSDDNDPIQMEMLAEARAAFRPGRE